MTARRAFKGAEAAHRAVGAAKVALGERGPVWWTDGTPDLERRMACNAPYAAWSARLPKTATGTGDA